ncbi:MAG: hypothetical protein II612_05755 [Prevotella sp.]|nr:hypothetical protein [Prevotella sp.]
MNRLQLYRELRRHVSLSEKRSPVMEQNRTAKVIVYIMSGFMVVYLMFLGIILAVAANGTRMATPAEFLFMLMPFILTLDFLLRFIGQQTPAQLVKPYLLLPIAKYACVEAFLLRSVFSVNNLLWMFVTVPYAIICVLFSYGFGGTVGFLLGFQGLIAANSLHYMLWRTMIARSVFWWAAPLLLYSALFLPWIVGDFEDMLLCYAPIGEALTTWQPLSWLAVVALIALLFFVNRAVQYRHTTVEAVQTGERQLRTVSQFSFLDRYGEVGEYVKLELKSVIRNKNIRTSFIYSIAFTLFLAVIISYTDIYDGAFTSKFFIVYAFIINGGMLLVKVMAAEGNYIDCLMVHHENILQLLTAKYYFYCALLLLPLLIMLPTVFAGKYSLLLLLAIMAFTAGPLFCLLMQLAVYNRQTIPLNAKLVSKGSVETNWFAFAAEMIAMFAPVAIIAVLNLLCTPTCANIIMLLIGLSFVVTHKLWIRNIYDRFMKRRYQNIESFRNTR